MADFNLAYKVTMENEGGYANNPQDRGGETYKGISRKHHPEWPGWVLIDRIKDENSNQNFIVNGITATNQILQGHVKVFYLEEFWKPLKLDFISSQEIATEMFDTGVNMGPGVAVSFLQRTLNVLNRNGKDYPDLILDFRMGPQTIKTLENHRNPGLVLLLLNILQGAKYISIAENDRSQEIFMRSWFSRVTTNTKL